MVPPAPDLPPMAAPTAPGTQPAPTALPFASDELQAILRSPARILDLVLGDRQRLGHSIADGTVLRQLALLLATCTLVAALPYGLIRGWSTTFSIAVLYGGTVLMCWPSLQVFGSYLGGFWRPMQSLTMALLVAAVAALFTLGFAPIVWFLRATMANGDWIDGDVAYLGLLAIGLLAGLSQLGRCIAESEPLRRMRSSVVVLGLWQLLVAFVAWRMARELGLFG